jgi:hypothetical protein
LRFLPGVYSKVFFFFFLGDFLKSGESNKITMSYFDWPITKKVETMEAPPK